jgi:hypothetical protein
MRQHTSAYVGIRQHERLEDLRVRRWPADACVRQHTSAYVSIRQRTSAYVSIRTSVYTHLRLELLDKRRLY